MTANSARESPVEDREDDDRAMSAVAVGDGDALREIFDRWKLPMLNFLYRSLGNFADAEDLTLAVFTEVWRAAPRYRDEGTFSAWLFAIARGKLRHEWRRRRRKPVIPAPVELMELADPLAGDETERRESEEALLEAIQRLPEIQRSALLLSVQTPLSTEEIAATLGVRSTHLYVLIHRARTRLKKYLKENDE